MKSISAIGFIALCSAIVIAPMALLAAPRATFGDDWNNNLWMIGYARRSLLARHWFPDEYIETSNVGVPQPIFYGPRLYPLLALLAVPLGPQAALRGACLILWSLQFWLIYRLCRCVGADRIHAVVAGAIVSWSVYPLTNLYDRGALAEFFATALLSCAMAAGGLALLSPDRSIRFALLAALLGALALEAHAPTALVGGGLLLTLIFPALLLRLPRRNFRFGRRIIVTVLLAMLVAAILSPWIYALLRFAQRFAISVPGPFYNGAGHWQRFAWIDGWRQRLSPLPLPQRGAPADFMLLGHHVDAQWNLPLALLAVFSAIRALAAPAGAAVRTALPLMAVAAIAAAGLLILSICPPLQDLLTYPIGAAIQFPYRLVSHVNLALFVLLIAAWVARPPTTRRAALLVLAVAIGLSGAALAMKLHHGAKAMVLHGPSATELNLYPFANRPVNFVGQNDYTLQVPERALPLSLASSANPPLALDAPAGAGPVEGATDVVVTMPNTRWIVTSIMNFPWNRLVLNGRPIPFTQVHNLYFRQTILLPAGDTRLGYRFDPDPIWVRLDRLSWMTLIVLVVLCTIAFIARRRGGHEQRNSLNPDCIPSSLASEGWRT